jgi:2'-hydroxyisoflavone reductase
MSMTSRREFLGTTLGAIGLATACRPGALGSPGTSKRILILGGTGFVGPHQVRHALARGHTVSIFNRGRSAPGMFGSTVEELVGDRANNLDALRGRRWDIVIDESASQGPTAPDWVRSAATLLKDNVDQYVFISTRSVYANFTRVPMTADAPVITRRRRRTR